METNFNYTRKRTCRSNEDATILTFLLGETKVIASAILTRESDSNRNGLGYHFIYALKLSVGRKRAMFQFHDSIFNWEKNQRVLTQQGMIDALDCLCRDAQCGAESFEDFCSEFEYDTDSRNAYSVWQACAKTTKAFESLGLDTSELAELLEQYESVHA